MSKLNQDAILLLEQPLIKVPLEQLKRQLKSTQKTIEKEVLFLTNRIPELQQSNDATKIKDLVDRLHKLKKKVVFFN
jgi:macrophage erythroblast attacher